MVTRVVRTRRLPDIEKSSHRPLVMPAPRYVVVVVNLCFTSLFGTKGLLSDIVVVIVNLCFTSLFGTKGLLSDIVIR